MCRRAFFTLITLSTLFMMTACEQSQQAETRNLSPSSGQPTEDATAKGTTAHDEVIHAVAELQPTEGNQTSGRVEFTLVPEGVRIVVQMQGLTSGKYGFHVHEFGDCSAPDAKSAGEHFNPLDSPHGGPDGSPQQRHAGDLGNIEGNEDGSGYYERVDQLIELTGPDSILGRSVVVHAEEDDFTSQPSGDAGDRIACGVIQEVPHQ